MSHNLSMVYTVTLEVPVEASDGDILITGEPTDQTWLDGGELHCSECGRLIDGDGELGAHSIAPDWQLLN